MGEHPRPLESSGLTRERGGGEHVLGPRIIAGEAECHIRLDRRRQVAGAFEELTPGAVVVLLRADPVRRARRRRGVSDAEELSEQEVLGVHRHVRLELTFPPSLRSLEGYEVVAGTRQRPIGTGVNLDINGRHGPLISPQRMRGR